MQRAASECLALVQEAVVYSSLGFGGKVNPGRMFRCFQHLLIKKIYIAKPFLECSSFMEQRIFSQGCTIQFAPKSLGWDQL
jgi:hypothetical protein